MVIEVGEREEVSMSSQFVVHWELRWQWSDTIPDLLRTVTGRWGERQGGSTWVQDDLNRYGSHGGGGR